MNESLNDQIYISSFNDPTVALETTQSNQTYSFKQVHETHGNVENQEYLSYYKQEENGLLYSSPDGFNWSLAPEQLIPDNQPQRGTGKSNDLPPVTFADFQQSLVLEPIETLALTQGRLDSIDLTEYQDGYATGIADL